MGSSQYSLKSIDVGNPKEASIMFMGADRSCFSETDLAVEEFRDIDRVPLQDSQVLRSRL